MTALSHLDRGITIFLAALLPHTPSFDALFGFFSFWGISWIVWIGLSVILLATSLIVYRHNQRKEHRVLMITIHLLAAMFISFVVVSIVLKPLAQRTRPTAITQSTDYPCPVDYSFPSGHAAVAFAGLGALTYWDHNRKRNILYWLIALAITYSRLYLGCHYMLDVVCGAAIGYTISRILPMMMRYHPKRASV